VRYRPPLPSVLGDVASAGRATGNALLASHPFFDRVERLLIAQHGAERRHLRRRPPRPHACQHRAHIRGGAIEHDARAIALTGDLPLRAMQSKTADHIVAVAQQIRMVQRRCVRPDFAAAVVAMPAVGGEVAEDRTCGRIRCLNSRRRCHELRSRRRDRSRLSGGG
jgi:hypothetical protein